MRRKFSRNHSLSVVVPFIAILILSVAFVAPAQMSGAGQLSAHPVVVSAQQGAAQQVPQVSRVRFAPAVTYDSGATGGSMSVAFGDLRGDGIQDLVVTNGCQSINGWGYCSGPGEIGVLLGNGDGTFQPASIYNSGGYWATSVVIGDLNGDGHPDLVVVTCSSVDQYYDCTGPGEVNVLMGNGDGTFQPAVSYDSGGASSVAIGDLRGNGILDLVVANGDVGVLMGNGDGTFQPVVAYSSGGNANWVAIGDLRGDGILDLVVTDYAWAGAVDVLLGNGDGTFQAPVSYSSGGLWPVYIAIGDLRGNGILDVVVANACQLYHCDHGAVDVLLGNGDGTFQAAASYIMEGAAYSVAIGDVNGDGNPDLVVANPCRDPEQCGHGGGLSVFLGNGDGTFQAHQLFSSGGIFTRSAVIGDVNGDGRPDLLAASLSTNVSVLLNLTKDLTATTITSSPNPSHVNQPVTFTATVTSSRSVPNGSTVTFYSGATRIGTGTTANGVASLNTSFSKAKTYTIKASYAGGGFFKASSGTMKQVVEQ